MAERFFMNLVETVATRVLSCEPMEPRILYSAGAVPLQLAEAVIPVASQSTVQIAANATSSHELVVIDARVADSVRLSQSLQAKQAAGRWIEVLLIDADSDGIQAISNALQTGQGRFDAVHLIAQGEPGRLQLGSSMIDMTTVRAHAGTIAGWGSALSADGDLLLYGCDLAAGEGGTEMIDALAALTGADVAASTDATGSERWAGNWMLEYWTGNIEADLVIGAVEQSNGQGLLSTTPVNAGLDTIVNTTTNGSQQTTTKFAGRQIAANAIG